MLDKKIKSSDDGEDPENSQKVEEKVDDEVKTGQDELKTKLPGFKLQERFQQIKAAHREKVKEEMAPQEASISPEVDKEEILKAEARKTVEEIPGLMKEEKNEGGEETDEKVKDEETGNKDETPKLAVKQYSDKGSFLDQYL